MWAGVLIRSEKSMQYTKGRVIKYRGEGGGGGGSKICLSGDGFLLTLP